MAYMTDFADWLGGFIEAIDNLYMSITPPIMLILAIISVFSLLTIVYMWIKQKAQEEV